MFFCVNGFIKEIAEVKNKLAGFSVVSGLDEPQSFSILSNVMA